MAIKSIEDSIADLLLNIESDNSREGLKETPSRVARAYDTWFSGYKKDAGKILNAQFSETSGYNQMVTVKGIPVYSKCEHHMADIFGTASVSYIPRKHVVGLSKLSRLVDMYARRLQVQERLTKQISDALQEHLDPIGCGVIIQARHMCMESRGICQQGHHTITTALNGVYLKGKVRREFLDAVR